jgi:hypothetical protein
MCLTAFMTSTVDVSDLVLDLLSPIALVNLRGTNKAIYGVVSSYLNYYFGSRRLTLLLETFFHDILGFRRVQKSTGVLISGLTALSFVGCFEGSSNDLDLYVSQDTSSDVFAFLRGQGYDCPEATPNLSRRQDYSYDSAVIREVHSFVRSTSSQNAVRVQVTVTEYSPIMAILRFHSSTHTFSSRFFTWLKAAVALVMNFICWDKVVSLYPVGILNDGMGLACTHPWRTTNTAMEKYEKRGFHILRHVRRTMIPWYILPLARHVGDRKTWTIPLDVSELTTGTPHWSLEYLCSNSWEVTIGFALQDDPEFSYAQLQFDCLRSVVLENPYTCSPYVQYMTSLHLEHLKMDEWLQLRRDPPCAENSAFHDPPSERLLSVPWKRYVGIDWEIVQV